MLGDFEDIDERRFPTEAKLSVPLEELRMYCIKFTLRPPGPDNAKECLEVIQSLTRTVFWKYVRWGFKNTERLPSTLNNISAAADEKGTFKQAKAVTYFHRETGMIDVWITVEILQPLLDLNGDLTSAERLGLRVHIANIIIHELMHVFYHARERYHGHNNLEYHTGGSWEPFFEDEPILEAGWSGENAVSTLNSLNDSTNVQIDIWRRYHGLPPDASTTSSTLPTQLS